MNRQRGQATEFVGGWCTPATKTKLLALAQLGGRSQNRTLVRLIEEAATRADKAAVDLPGEPGTISTKQNRTQILADGGAVPA